MDRNSETGKEVSDMLKQKKDRVSFKTKRSRENWMDKFIEKVNIKM